MNRYVWARECLLIREKTEPDAWTTFNTKSLLGGSLLGQKNYSGAEPLLLAGYEGMQEREASCRDQRSEIRGQKKMQAPGVALTSDF